jgi:HJR/Mrr/RecB family endonuclease
MTEAPRNLAELKAISDPAERARATKLYLDKRVEQARREAIAVRDEAIREVLKSNGPTATARLCDVSLSLVKLVRGSGPA